MKKIIILCLLLTIISPKIGFASSFSRNVENNQQQTIIKKPNLLSKTWFKSMQYQKELNKNITTNIKEIKNGNSAAFWVVISFAFLYGIIHAIGPGHGKLLIISYFTSHRDKWWQGIFMGFQIAFMHIISAVILVILTDGVTKYAFGNSPSKEMLLIKLISYASIIIIGIVMMLKTYREQKKSSCTQTVHNKKSKSQWLLSISIGLVPCTGALLLLFYSMSQQMLFTGICIVLSMGLGIALSLSTIGIICIVTRQNISNLSKPGKIKHFSKYLRYLGYILIIIIGTSMFTKELFKIFY